jgi:hypothetical protein
MTPAAPRSYARLGAMVVIAAVVIGAGIFASTLFGTATKAPQTAATAPTTSSCSPTSDLAAPRRFAFNIAVNYTGRWEATATGYSPTAGANGATPAFVDCYTGSGVGLIYLSDWNEGGQATLQLVAEKTDSGGGNLTISVTFGASNSMTEANSTSLPEGSATVTATMLGEAAVVSNFTATTSSAGATRLYDVTFLQEGDCSPPVYVLPWSVTLGNETIAQPSNATLPIKSPPSTYGPANQSLTTIAFSVPDGVYQYTISPPGTFSSDSGSITVNGAGVLVMVYGPAIGCRTTQG